MQRVPLVHSESELDGGPASRCTAVDLEIPVYLQSVILGLSVYRSVYRWGILRRGWFQALLADDHRNL